MTAVCVPLPMSNMDYRASMYSSQLPLVGNYVSPTPSVNQASYENSPSIPSTYPVTSMMHTRSQQTWDHQDTTLFSHSERVIAKERRREQNRASQRAYRKRKEDTVKGLYDSIKDLRRDSETLRAENIDLRSKLKTLHEENRRLRNRGSSLKSCLQCSEADVPCSKTNPACLRCEEVGISCVTMSPELESRQATIEASDHEDQVEQPPYIHATKSQWFDEASQIPIMPDSIDIGGIPAYDVTSYDIQEMQRQHTGNYDTEPDDDSLLSSSQHDPADLLQPQVRQMYRSRSVGTLPNAGEPLRPRSATVFRPPGF